MFEFIKKIFDPNAAAIKTVTPIVDDILSKEEHFSTYSLEQMQERIEQMRMDLRELIDSIPAESKIALRINSDRTVSDIEKKVQDKLHEFLPEFFAIMRELNKRKFNKPHYKVQLIAATILAQGNKLTELKTGEGKTQVFHLPAALYGLTGRGSHVITVNDYLAKRDGEYAGHAMADLNISVGIITPQASYRFVKDENLKAEKGEEAAQARSEINVASMTDMKGINLLECSKEEAYAQNVVYGTNNEFGFDYLRDNMTYELDKRVQKELYFCIIDEADSILIDEARTPLIISAPAAASNDLYVKFAKLVKKLDIIRHYVVDEKSHSVTLTEEGVERVEKELGVENVWEDYKLAHHLDNALKAEALYKIDEEYILQGDEVMIVDEFTGRVLSGRRYSDGLHQAIEAKEGVEIKRESKTMATITFQNFFRLYKILAGGSGTIITEAEEFLKIYSLESYVVPTNKPVIRKDKNDKVYKHRIAKFNAVVEEIIRVNEIGQPILVGTTSVEASEYLSRLLDKRGIKHEVLNAKFHEREAAIVQKAGEKFAVTVATNMAGRGTDIPLSKEVIELGGLYIIGTERHEARRIDNQLRGRAGRQGEPGESQFFVGLDDEIMRVQGGDIIKRLMDMINTPDDMPIETAIVGRSIESTQKKMEGHHFDTRKRLVDYDNVMNQQREIFYTRRYNIINLVDKAETKDDKGQYTAEALESIDGIKNKLIELLLNEVNNIVDVHFFSLEGEKLDYTKLINDYLDLADDEYVVKACKEIYTDYDNSDITKFLSNKILNNSQEEIINILSKIIINVFGKKSAEFGENLPEIYKITSLQSMDTLWTDHLDAMGDLRESIGLRGYAQRDPLVEYKNESFGIFQRFIDGIDSKVGRRILKIRKVAAPVITQEIRTNQEEVKDISTGTREMGDTMPKKIKPLVNNNIASRNDPCPCGSGLKYKKCGLINSPKHKI
jgi:preprotein translocase subunit SecA